MWLIFAGRCRDRHSSRPGFERASIFLLLLNSYESVCVCVFVELYIYFLLIIIIYSSTSDSLLVFFSLIFVLRVFELVFFTLFARHFKNEFNGKERLLSVSRIIFTFFFSLSVFH